jgi:plastocyanin
MRPRVLILLFLAAWRSPLATVQSAQPASAPKLPGHVVDVVAGDFFFRAPDTIPAELTTLRLRVLQGGHIALLVRLDSGHTAADLLRSRHEGHPRPAWVHFIGGPGFPSPTGSANATLVLVPGNYVLMCDVADRDGMRHFEKGMFHPIVVRANGMTAPRAVSLPAADAVVTMRDHVFEFSKPIRAGVRVLRVVNQGSVMHEFRVVHVLPGHTGRESIAWKPTDSTPRPDEDVTAIVGLVPGSDLVTTIPFTEGEYVVLCVPQLSHGMIQVLRVSP